MGDRFEWGSSHVDVARGRLYRLAMRNRSSSGLRSRVPRISLLCMTVIRGLLKETEAERLERFGGSGRGLVV